MDLYSFEDTINPTIVDRGFGYYSTHKVSKPQEHEPGYWKARAYGSEIYDVSVELTSSRSADIVDWNCTCPYDQGPVCKHVVALLYAVRDQAGYDRNGTGPSATNNKGRSRLQRLFDQLTKEELWDFIVDRLGKAEGLEEAFWTHFAGRLDVDAEREYRNILRNHLRKARDRTGFIDYRSAGQLARPLYELEEKAENLFKKGNYRQSSAIARVLIEELVDAIHHMDDSDGTAGAVIDYAFDTLMRSAEKASDELKEELFDWAAKELGNDKYSGFGFDTELAFVMPQLITKEEQGERFLMLLDRLIKQVKEEPHNHLKLSELVESKIRYLRQAGRDDEVRELLEQNKEMHRIRGILVDDCIAAGDYGKALQLCEVGISVAREEKMSGIESRWQEKLYEIARLQDDLVQRRRWAEKLMLNSMDKKRWFEQLKSTYSQAEWNTKRGEYINKLEDLVNSGRLGDIHSLIQIYKDEDMLDAVVKLLEQPSASIDMVDRYADLLADDYPEALLDLYEAGIKAEAPKTGRKVYRALVRYLKRMQRVEQGNQRARKLVEELLVNYNNRPAMEDEFRKAFPEWV